jgi:pimeloyl-ACP methyl ester carboxylesterase
MENINPPGRIVAHIKQWLSLFSLSRIVRWTIYGSLAYGVYKNWHEDLPMNQLIQKYTFPDSKFVEIDGMNVHYRVKGKGEPILLLHDEGGSLQTWTNWTDVLSKNYQVISVDLPGYGLTGAHPRGSYSSFMYAGFLEKFVDSIHLKPFVIVGNGLGAQISWFYAAEHIGKVKKMILLNAQGFEKKRSNWLTYLCRTPVINSVLLKITPITFMKMALEEVYSDDKLVNDSLVNRHFELFLRPGARKAFISRAQVTENNPPTEDFIEKITIPTLILWGAEDRRISPENAYEFHKKIRSSDLRIYENTGHWSQEENPTQTVEDVKAFLEGKF